MFNRDKLRLIALLAFALLCTLACSSSAGVFCVKTNGNDSYNGRNWKHAKKTVQAAIDVAKTGDEVWVAAGTYLECLMLTSGTSLYGGFAGIEKKRDQRDWEANPTVLDGDWAGSVITIPEGADATRTIDGFTITHGSSAVGGGILCNGPITISNNTIELNTATYGGGIYGYGSLIMNRNTIYLNHAKRCGGGLYIDSRSAQILSNRIVGNMAVDHCDEPDARGMMGGGIFCYGDYQTLIAGNLIAGNDAYAYYEYPGPEGKSLSFEGYGGGIYLSGSIGAIVNNTIVYNSTSVGGWLTYHGGVGGVHLDTSDGVFANNIVARNYPLDRQIDYMCYDITFTSNCVFGDGPGYIPDYLDDGTHITQDPLLEFVAGWPHLSSNSPCIDAGDNLSTEGILQQDIDYDPRIISGLVDIGCDEWSP